MNGVHLHQLQNNRLALFVYSLKSLQRLLQCLLEIINLVFIEAVLFLLCVPCPQFIL